MPVVRDLYEISANDWNGLCWNGSLNGYASDVIFACEKAVALAPNDGAIRDSRGLARALTGDFDGAIEDFQAYIDLADSPDEMKNQRREWIEALERGENPFTEEVLESLR